MDVGVVLGGLPWVCPLKMLDYRSQGVPVVAVPVGDTPALADHLGGHVVPWGDAWPDAVRRALQATPRVAHRSWEDVVEEAFDAPQEGGLDQKACEALITNVKLDKFKLRKKHAEWMEEGELLPAAFDHAPDDADVCAALFTNAPVEWNVCRRDPPPSTTLHPATPIAGLRVASPRPRACSACRTSRMSRSD